LSNCLIRLNRKDRTVKGKIRVVDDDVSVRELFSDVFTEADYKVIAADGGTEALKQMKSH